MRRCIRAWRKGRNKSKEKKRVRMEKGTKGRKKNNLQDDNETRSDDGGT